MKILKEKINEFLENENKEKIIYISSSLKNLDYYYFKLKNSSFNINFFKEDKNNDKELYDINVKILELLKSDKKEIILIDFSLALNVFFREIESFSFFVGKTYNIKEIEEKLIDFDYEKQYIVNDKIQYSKRGDIIDIFSYNIDFPIRLDFFDDELEKIKLFDIETQKSFKELKEVKIFSNKIQEREYLLSDFNADNINFFVENKEILEHILETKEFLEPDIKLRKRYENILNISQEIQVIISEKVNYQSEIQKEKENINKRGIKYKNIDEIKEGDFVIHIEYGIGKYIGLETIDNQEYFLIQYADDGELYVPIEKLHRIEKYISVNSDIPTLYSLGTRGFRRKQQKHREEIEKIAKELIKLQAIRQSKKGIMFNEDSVWQKEFEEKFEHLETEDQLKAIRDVKIDMESSKMMDRIICGDVGYGKTEVAMRATFKAIESGYQVALLAPTTVLANQHYERFKKRFADYPINIEMYSRLSQSKKTLENIYSKKTDLIIGTHKILSDSVIFNNLGLLIIDEEQKFGVKDKQKIKEKKNDVDVLTLTATPIPRTLNLALLGIRDISVISTPPIQKLPIKTKILEKITEKQLQEIILKEIARDGQVFYISNDVKNMPKKCEFLRKILPEYIQVEYIHSKLGAKEIKAKIKDFEAGKFQVLLSSTIVENGIDILNANTIIIEDFNTLGLSQIYQLRGRVGRGKRQGYCYLLKKKVLNTKSQKKEESIKNIENINSAGYIISMEDMNIRGAGEILGEKQHGAIETFGYSLYVKMLNDEIKRQQHKKEDRLEIVKIDINNKGFIPSEYIQNDEKLKIYKRFSEFERIEQVNDIIEEIKDRFGAIPKHFEDFCNFMKIKIYAQNNFIEEVVEKNNNFYLKYATNMVKLSKQELFEKLK